MSERVEVRVPDMGDFDRVDVIEVLVSRGDEVREEQSLITLESDKASLELPSPRAGSVAEVAVAVGDQVSEGDLVAVLEVQEAEAGAAAPEVDDREAGDGERQTPSDVGDAGPEDAAAGPEAGGEPVSLPEADLEADVVVLGAGPGGYTAAFRAADLGLDVLLVDRRQELGGVCLNVGCIPSKAMLHAAHVVDQAAEFAERGIEFGEPRIDLPRLREWKQGVVDRLTKGLSQLADKRGVRLLRGTGTLAGPHLMRVETDEGAPTIAFRHAILAVGSRPVLLPEVPEDERIMTSTGAIALEEIPGSLLVVGGGIIGLEMAQIYSSLGSEVSVVELLDGLMPGVDRDLVRPLERRITGRYNDIWTGTKVTGMAAEDHGIRVSFEGDDAPESRVFDRVLVAIGRRPNGGRVAAQEAGVEVDDRGFIPVDERQRTNVEHVYAIGDVVGEPMLAHKASHQGKVAAEVIAGEASAFDARVVPSVAYTDPEVAWAGLTEEEAAERGIEVDKGTFPWGASGRALGMGRSQGLTKLLFDPESRRLLGAGIVGPGAGDLISEICLAMEMGSDAADIGLTIHPHPTLSETVAFAAEAVEGTLTDLYVPRRD